MDLATAKKCFDALSVGIGHYWDCKVLTKDGFFKANSIQLALYPEIENSLKLVTPGNQCDVRHVYDLDLSKHSNKAVLEWLRFVYLKLADLTKDSVMRRNKKQRYLVEEVWALAIEFQITELQAQCVNTLESNAIAVDEDNFLRLAQLGVTMELQSLRWRCFQLFKKKLAADPVVAITEVRQHVPMFLNAVICDSECRLPDSDDSETEEEHGNSEHGVVIEAHSFDDKLFEEVVASLGNSEPTKNSMSDFQIHCSDTAPDRPIRCHRNILLRVPHFERMLAHENKETKQGSVEIDAEKDVVMEVLKYVYTGSTNDLGRILHHSSQTCIAEEVINLAELYGFHKLKEQCQDSLLNSQICSLNVMRLLGLSCLHELVELQRKCLRYFFDHRLAVMTTEDWMKAEITAIQAVICMISKDESTVKLCLVRNRQDLAVSYVSTVDMNGIRSTEVEIIWRNLVGLAHQPIHQLDDRTVMIICQRQAILFDLVDHSITGRSRMMYVHGHAHGGACMFNGELYACASHSLVERYNRETNMWQGIASMKKPRSVNALVVWKGNLLAIGGYESSIESYDPVADRWEVIREMELNQKVELQRSAAIGVTINDEVWIYLSTTGKLWRVDLDADEWIEAPLPADTRLVHFLFEREDRLYLIAAVNTEPHNMITCNSTKLFTLDEISQSWNEVMDIVMDGDDGYHHAMPVFIR